MSWYDVLLTVRNTPVVQLNGATAVAERDGPAAGLALVDDIAGFDGHALLHAARAELLARLGRVAEARAAYDAALALPQNDAPRAHLGRRFERTAHTGRWPT